MQGVRGNSMGFPAEAGVSNHRVGRCLGAAVFYYTSRQTFQQKIYCKFDALDKCIAFFDYL